MIIYHMHDCRIGRRPQKSTFF